MKLDSHILTALDDYIEEQLYPKILFQLAEPSDKAEEMTLSQDASVEMDGFIRQHKEKETFTVLLDRLRAERNIPPVELYRKALIDRRLYSQIMGERHYQPAKNTVIAFGLALGLNQDLMNTLLQSAGFSFNRSAEADLVICFCIEKGIFDIAIVNELLNARKQSVLR